jgi:hypothetical protein
MNEKELAAAYQPLFNLMNEHGLVLTKQEMDEIIIAAEKVRDAAFIPDRVHHLNKQP